MIHLEQGFSELDLKKIKSMVQKMYDNGEIENIQDRAAQIYFLAMSKKLTHLAAVKMILSHGVKYNDLLEGILRREL